MVSVEVQVDPGVREQVRQIFSGEKEVVAQGTLLDGLCKKVGRVVQ